jgi:hypothetical protein
MLLKDLEQMPAGTIFATGLALDNEDGLFISNTGKELRWVAVVGGNIDWSIYCYYAERSMDWIKAHGDKVHTERNIRKCIICDDEMFARYRY